MALRETPAIEDLRLLVAIVESGSETGAAKLFGVKQPSVARRLRVFKGKQPLLTSDGAIQLTAKGQKLLPSIRELLRQYDQLKGCIAAKQETPQILSIATGASVSQYYLPAAIAKMRELAPDLEIEVHATRGSQRITGIANGDFDLAIVSHDRLQIKMAQTDKRGARPELVVEDLATQSLCVLAAKSSSGAERLSGILAGQEVPLDMLSRLPLIGPDRSSGIRRQIERAFASRSEQLRFGVNAAGWLAVKEYAKHGLGVGILPLGLLSREDIDEFVIRRLPAELCIRHYLIHREDATNPYLDGMKTSLSESAKQHQETVQRLCQGLV